MASGKPRPHRSKGRPRKDKAYTRDLELEIRRLRALNADRLRNNQLWKAIENVIAIAETLEDQTTAIQSPTWNSSGHTAEPPTFTGVRMAPAGPIKDEHGNEIPGSAEAAYDETKHRGNRELYHSGKHAEALLNHLIRNISWAAQRARDRLVLKPYPAPKPREPRLDEPENCAACLIE